MFTKLEDGLPAFETRVMCLVPEDPDLIFIGKLKECTYTSNAEGATYSYDWEIDSTIGKIPVEVTHWHPLPAVNIKNLNK